MKSRAGVAGSVTWTAGLIRTPDPLKSARHRTLLIRRARLMQSRHVHVYFLRHRNELSMESHHHEVAAVPDLTTSSTLPKSASRVASSDLR